MFPQKFSALSNEKRYSHGDSPGDVLHPELCSPRKGAFADCVPLSPVPVPAGGDAEGASLSCPARSTQLLLQAAPRHPPNPAKPALTTSSFSWHLLWPFYGHTSSDFAVAEVALKLSRTGPFPAPLKVLEFKDLLVGTLCRGLLFTAIKRRW